MDRIPLPVLGLCGAVRPGHAARPDDPPPRARLPPGHAPDRGFGGWFRGGHSPAAADRLRVRVAPRRDAGRGAPDGVRTAHRSQPVLRPARRAGRRLHPRPVPHARVLRPRGGAGRPVDDDGARRQPPPVHLPAAAQPFRTELPRRAPTPQVWRVAPDQLRRRHSYQPGGPHARAPALTAELPAGRGGRGGTRGELPRTAPHPPPPPRGVTNSTRTPPLATTAGPPAPPGSA